MLFVPIETTDTGAKSDAEKSADEDKSIAQSQQNETNQRLDDLEATVGDESEQDGGFSFGHWWPMDAESEGLTLGSKVCFGYTISGTTVTIYAGEVHYGENDAVDVAETDKTIDTDHQYIWAEYNIGTGAGIIADPNVNRPKSGDPVHRVWLYRFRLIGGVVSLEKVGHFGNIEIPGVFGVT